jgi:hypothetical protein
VGVPRRSRKAIVAISLEQNHEYGEPYKINFIMFVMKLSTYQTEGLSDGGDSTDIPDDFKVNFVSKNLHVRVTCVVKAILVNSRWSEPQVIIVSIELQ